MAGSVGHTLIVELGERAIRLLEGSTGREGIRVTACAEVAVAEAAGFSDPAQRQVLRDRLRQLLHDRFHTREATAVLSESLTSLRTFAVPAAARASLRPIVELRAEAEIPIPLDQLAWGYTTWQDGAPAGGGALGGGRPLPAVDTPPEGTTVCLVVARAGDVQQRLSLIEEAGFRPRRIQIGAFALCETYRRSAASDVKGSVCLLSVRPDGASAVFVEGGRPRWCRHLPVTQGTVPPELARELRESMRYFATDCGGSRPREVVVFGAANCAPALCGTLAERLGLKVSAAAAINGITTDLAEGEQNLADGWATPLGAMFERSPDGDSGLDLLPSLSRGPRRAEPQAMARRSVAALALCVVLILALTATWLWMKSARLAMVERALRSVAVTQDDSAGLESELAVLSAVARERTPWLDVLRELSELAPPGITLKHALLSSVHRGATVEFRGTASDYQSVERFARKLNASTWFEMAVVTQMQKPKGSIEFGVSCRLKSRPGAGGERR